MVWGLGWQDLFQRVFMLDSGRCLCLILAGGYSQWQYNFNLILLKGFKELKVITILKGSAFMILNYMNDLPRYLFVSCGPDEAQLESRLPGEISITSGVQMTPFLWQKSKRSKEFLDKSERGDWKSWLKTQHSENKDHGIQSHYFMANRWGNNGNSDRLLFGLQNHCRWWLQPWN